MERFLAERLSGIPGFAIDRMANLADQLVEVIRMENADTNLAPPSHVIAATREALNQARYNSYLPFTGLDELKEAVALRYQVDDGLEYEPASEILITCGATEAMTDVLLSLVNPGDEVLLADPTYAGMIYRVRLAGGVAVFMPFVEEDGWRLEVEKLPDLITPRTKLIFIMSPNMPTGAVYTESELRGLARMAEKHDLLILYNAALDKIVFGDTKNLNIASMPGMKDRTIVVGSVSKNYNMIGWRVGWVAADRRIIEAVAKVHIYNAVAPSGIAQAGAVAALTGPQDCVGQFVRTYERRAAILVEGLGCVERMKVVRPGGGWFLIANIKRFGLDSYTFSEMLLREEKVAVTPMRDWGSINGEGYVRFIFSNSTEEEITAAAARVQSVALRM
jgi:N-succinyldiaminopimelate aminotransferase